MNACGLGAGQFRPRKEKRKLHAVTLAGVLGTAVIALVLGLWGPEAEAAQVAINLYGKTLAGWSTSPGTETNPGPTFTVNLGDDIRMTLTSEDPPIYGGHAFWIDYNNNGIIDLGSEPSSPEFTAPIMFAFTANVAGTFTYYCSIHSGPPYSPTSSLMRGTWITRGPPSVAVRSPTVSSSWSGGVPHDIRFDLAHPDPPATLTVWVNYSASGGAISGPIAGPISGTPNPNAVSWTPTGLNVLDAIINITAMDSAGRGGFGRSPAFEVDSTPPTVTSTVPSSGASGVAPNAQVLVVWSEGMNRSASGFPASFGLRRVADGFWVAGSTGWSADSKQMTFTRGTALDPFTTYEALVNATARDDSDPGNRVGMPLSWQFTTGAAIDLTPPVIISVVARPPVQAEGGLVNVTAAVTDDRAVGAVSLRVVGPSVDLNLTMVAAGGTTWFVNRSYATKGTYTVTVWATDGSGNVASRGGTFSIRDLTPPPTPGNTTAVVRADGSIAVTWSAVGVPDLAGYHVYRATTAGGPYSRLTAQPIPPSGPRELVDRNVEPGVTYRYVVTAIDLDGNESPLSLEAVATRPTTDLLPWILVAGVLATAALVAVVWVRRRRLRGPSQ